MRNSKVVAKAEQERKNLRQYCRQCTDSQLQNVHLNELERGKRASDPRSEVGATADVFADEAAQELKRRGIL
jgi:hypothetical protein